MSAAACALQLPDLAALANRTACAAGTPPGARWNPKAQGLRHLGRFNPLPHWLSIRRFWKDPQGNIRKLNPSAKLCYATMLRICGPDGTVTASLQKLAFDQGLTWRQVHRVLVDLEKMNLIVRHQRGNNLPSTYEFLAHAWMMAEPEVFDAPTPAHARILPPPRRRALQADLPGMFAATSTTPTEMSTPASLSPATVLTFPPAASPLMSVPSN
jgi:hypothetical protein